MRIRERTKSGAQVKYLLLIFVIVAANMVIVLPLSSPRAKAYEHLYCTKVEDGDPTYDADGQQNHVVVWYGGGDHRITMNYVVDQGYTLIIPSLGWDIVGNSGNAVYFRSLSSDDEIHVYGTLITTPSGSWRTKTAFLSEKGGWVGITFKPGSNCKIVDCLFRGACWGLVFEPGSNLLEPGIINSTFDQMQGWGMQMDGVNGHTNISYCRFDDTTYEASTAVDVKNCCLNISNSEFMSHDDNRSQIYISNADVHVNTATFVCRERPGYEVQIEGNSNGTVLNGCNFLTGAVDSYYVKVEGSSPLINNCSFITYQGSNSVIATDDEEGVPAHPIVRNPYNGMEDFDNTTLNATGDSSITLQWYMNVYVKDQNDNPIGRAPVWVEDRNNDPAEPPTMLTNPNGWAKYFAATELILYENNIQYFSPYNVTAMNATIKGYAVPEIEMNCTKDVVVVVPFNPIPNIPPNISWLSPIEGVLSGHIVIGYKLSDPTPWDEGNLSIRVYYSFDNKIWFPAAQGPGGDPTDWLYNDTLYHFVWNSYENISNLSVPTVFIKIVPYDRGGSGTPGYTGEFAVDNKAPFLREGPTVNVTDTTALIEWEVDERANATVWYGPGDTMTIELWNYSYSPLQSILLTGLQPGRYYTYVINSTDAFGQKYTSSPTTFTFDTQVRIQLYEGWNMISYPPFLPVADVGAVLSSIECQWDIVEWYDASDQNDYWKHNNTNKPQEMNDLHKLNERMGLWIHMNEDALLILDHIDLTFDPLWDGTIIHLHPGWNFIGYPSIKTRTVTDALSGIDYNLVQTYDAATGEWYEYDGTSGDLMYMELGRGYWIHCNKDYDWHIDYL